MGLTVHLDTNAYCGFMRGDADAVWVIEHAPRLAVCPIVLGELKAGFILGSRPRENLDQLERFLDTPRVTVAPFEDGVTDRYARIYKQLRRDGRPVPTNDLWIAAFVAGDEELLFTRDQHFDFVESIRVIHDQSRLRRALSR